MEKIEMYKILTIEDQNGKEKDYTVANLAEYNDTTYLYLIEVDQDENLIEQNQMIARLVLKEGEEGIEPVTDPEELKEISKVFYELFKEVVKEEVSEN